jgi:2-C-methyl-D-erythritol 4-phosphate cytidylyltransferase
MELKQPQWAIITAGGSGVRMQADMPKQFLELCGKPILMHTIEIFAAESIPIIVVLPQEQIEYWKELCHRYTFTLPHDTISGGTTRFHSVKRGISMLPDKGLVAIHDGVRPLVSRTTITTCFRVAARYGCAVPAVPVIDSMREVLEVGNRAIDRSSLRAIQTPQVFDIALLKKAYTQPYLPAFTDDASVFESHGNPIRLTEGNAENLKITCPTDLAMAETLMKLHSEN